MSQINSSFFDAQQFFGESSFQWNVPIFRTDVALTNGPFPLMTLFTKQLWRATPYGFDEALPKGHEDWAFWLQLSRLPLQSHKLEGYLTKYRFKKNSKMRNREKYHPEIPRLLRTLFPDLYPIRKLLVDHWFLKSPQKGGITEVGPPPPPNTLLDPPFPLPLLYHLTSI